MATSLSAGLFIREMLGNANIPGVTKIFPVATDTAQLPYISYRRVSLDPQAWKGGNADMVGVEVLCYASTYEQSLTIAEAARAALDCMQASIDALVLRSCLLVDSEEMWSDDAYVQRLVFNLKIA